MREILAIAARDLRPSPETVLAAQGYPPGAEPPEKLVQLLDVALDLFEEDARPTGLWMDVDRDEFERIYAGERNNDAETPLLQIYPRAERLALFAVTVGAELSEAITEVFRSGDFALASFLDSIASEAAERAGDHMERRFGEIGRKAGLADSARSLRYSPGYCGWHLSGQKALFAELNPGEIGITLRESFLMEPLKSMSGVIVAGPAEIHDFEDDFLCCATCSTRSCRGRIANLQEG